MSKRLLMVVGTIVLIAAAMLFVKDRFTNDEAWEGKVMRALAKKDCIPAPEKRYGSLRYDGPLIDTHYHIPHMDAPPPFAPDKGWPYMGDNITIADIACTLRQEKTRKAFMFFPVFPEGHARQFLDVAYGAIQQHADIFVPFIMPPESDNSPDGFPTVTAQALQEMLGVYPSLFNGFGEIGLYARDGGAAALPPDSPRLREIYPTLRKNKIRLVYFHLGEGQQESFERMLTENPDINFIWHGDQLIPYEQGRQNLKQIEEIISRHKNVFYTVDELYGDDWLIKPEVTREQFLAHLENYETLLQEDLVTWKGIIERHPDQFMWGTDRSDQVRWSHDPDVGQALTGYARAFIVRLNHAVQEKFSYKNAERLLGNLQTPGE